MPSALTGPGSAPEVAATCPSCRSGEISAETQLCDHCGFSTSEGDSLGILAAEGVERTVRQVLSPHYELKGLLGRGGMSLVYLAREIELNRHVALKVLPIQLLLRTAAAERFNCEAKIAASLDYHHIVPIYRVGATSSFLWYSMKYVKGRSLAQVLADSGRTELDICIDIVGQIASALQYAHRRGVIHRDIKPENVLIDDHGWVWVCDFGIAKAFGSIPLTDTGGTVGTPSYMSPEQCYGQKLDGRADEYSLATLTYRCLAGRTPFVSDTLGEMIRQQCLEPPPPLAETRPDLPAHISTAVLRAMRKIPNERFADVVEFVRALGGSVSIQEARTSLQELAQPVPKSQETPTRARWWRRHQGRLVLTLVAPVAIAAALTWPMQRGESPGGAGGTGNPFSPTGTGSTVVASAIQAPPPDPPGAASSEAALQRPARLQPARQHEAAATQPRPPRESTAR